MVDTKLYKLFISDMNKYKRDYLKFIIQSLGYKKGYIKHLFKDITADALLTLVKSNPLVTKDMLDSLKG